MIQLHPLPDAAHVCPSCQVDLEVKGWYIPGMRTLADLRCPQCEREFYGDLPAGHGLYYPMLLEKSTGVIQDRYEVSWFAIWLRDSYTHRVSSPVGFTVENFRPLKKPVLLNCLDKLYGHSLLKLLNAQHYIDQRKDYDLVLMVPKFLRWMVPDSVAEIWTVDLPLNRGAEWNDWLANEIERRINGLERCWLSVALSHPHPDDYDIERFTHVTPFPIEEWASRLNQPTVTFIWREDRSWLPRSYETIRQHVVWQLRRLVKRDQRSSLLAEQAQHTVALAEILQTSFPALDFAVAGLGRPGGLPPWIKDLRTLSLSEDIERSWCERYARSHIVVGVHGSNMLLPSAHAGATVALMPNKRWGNVYQDILFHNHEDLRQSMYRYRSISMCSPEDVAEIVASLLKFYHSAVLNFSREFCDHERIEKHPTLLMEAGIKKDYNEI